MDLFEQSALKHAPLAHRMRPLSLDFYFGQEGALSESSPLKAWIERDQLPSIILWGPPGCGKTTLAHIIAEKTKARFEHLSAVMAGVKDIKEVVERAQLHRSSRKTILFVDEIHRFSKSQQDALLPHVENGCLTLIGATTENPSFEVNSALLSRCKVIRLESLSKDGLKKIIQRALREGFEQTLEMNDECIDFLIGQSQGDARRALNLLENLSALENLKSLSPEEIKNFLEKAQGYKSLLYDKKGEEHYNVISAFIKSLRGSDPHGAIYYLARLLEGGEDPKFIARRMFIFASEDIGNADPQALLLAQAAQQAVLFVGMPEARINLAQVVSYLAMAPKSNASYLAIDKALAEVCESGALPVPMHLRNAPTQLMKTMGYGKDYQYAHDYKNSEVSQSHLPDEIQRKKFYEPKDSGLEKIFKERLSKKSSS